MDAVVDKVTPEMAKTYELKITRTFDAPRELVWRALTEPEMAKQWMGPRSFKATEVVLPNEAGGRWHLRMEGKRLGSEALAYLAQGGVVKEMRPPELLVYTFAWDDRTAVGLSESPFKENTVTVKLEERGNKTVMHFTQGPFATESECNGHNGGWNSAFDCFADFILREQPQRVSDPNDVPSELHIKRLFRAPLQLVFDAWTKPEMLARWWGPRHFTCTVHEWDARPGGNILLDMHGPDGIDHPMGGRFKDFYPPYRFIFTAAALDKNGKPMFENWNSVLFEEVDGGTLVVLDVHVMSATEVAPQYLKGMSAGWSSSLDKLAEILTTN